MIYLDDVADWTTSKTAKFIRIGVCTLFGVIAVLMILSSNSRGRSLNQTIQANEKTLGEKRAEYDKIKNDIAEFTSTNLSEVYNPTVASKEVAAIQSEYGAVYKRMTDADLLANQLKIEEKLNPHFKGRGINVSEWYPTKLWSYTWTNESTRASVVPSVPIVWTCRAMDVDDNSISRITSVATGMYDGKTDTFSEINVHETYFGKYVRDVVDNQFDYRTFYTGSIIPLKCVDAKYDERRQNLIEFNIAWKTEDGRSEEELEEEQAALSDEIGDEDSEEPKEDSDDIDDTKKDSETDDTNSEEKESDDKNVSDSQNDESSKSESNESKTDKSDENSSNSDSNVNTNTEVPNYNMSGKENIPPNDPRYEDGDTGKVGND